MDIKDLTGIGEPLTKLIETMEKALGWWFNPITERRQAKADAETIKGISQAVRENIDIPIVYEKNGIKIDSSDFNGLLERSKQRQLYLECIKQNNIELIIYAAAEKLAKVKAVDKDPVNSTWAIMFFDSAGYASDDILQKIWADILAKEVINPGQTSMRTLEIVRKLSAYEIKQFEKLANLILFAKDSESDVTDYFILSDEEVFHSQGLKYPEIMSLVDAGLFHANVSTVNTNIIIDPNAEESIYAGMHEVFRLKNMTDETIQIKKHIYLLSEAGKEIYNVIFHEKIIIKGNEDYYKLCEKCFVSEKVVNTIKII